MRRRSRDARERARVRKGVRHIRKEIDRRQERRDDDLTAEFGGAAHSQCGRKRAYPTRRLAEVAASMRDVPLRAYRCPFCGMWHLTHKTERRQDGPTTV